MAKRKEPEPVGPVMEAKGVRDTLILAGMDKPAAFVQRMIDEIVRLDEECDGLKDLVRDQHKELKAGDMRPEVARLTAEASELESERQVQDLGRQLSAAQGIREHMEGMILVLQQQAQGV